MARRHISQDEAHRLAKRVDDLQDRENRRRNAWAKEWPAGVHVARLAQPGSWLPPALHLARKLGHACVVTVDGDNLNFYALPLAEQETA